MSTLIITNLTSAPRNTKNCSINYTRGSQKHLNFHVKQAGWQQTPR